VIVMLMMTMIIVVMTLDTISKVAVYTPKN
jgi:hypothetical protein